MNKTQDMVIIEKRYLQQNIVELTLQGDLVSQMSQPGQFVQVSTNDGGTILRRPISIHEIDHEKQTLKIIFRVEGKGTKILGAKTFGDSLNIMGPLGTGFPVDVEMKGKTACLIGGGIGTPPLYELSKQLKAAGMEVIHVLGFNSKKECILEDKFYTLGDTYVSTVDGSVGTKGFVTDVLKEKQIAADIYFACGPTPMLYALEQSIVDKPLYVSFEERMACGMGACYACVCKTKKETGYRRICKDGPVFKAGEVQM